MYSHKNLNLFAFLWLSYLCLLATLVVYVHTLHMDTHTHTHTQNTMMHYVVKKTFTSPLEHLDVEYEQRTLFELTVGKLQKEQLRPGMEPRLLRFVLINNALRTLQCHMMKIEEPPLTLTEERDENAESFLCNTFKDGGLSLSPQSPPTPIKVRSLGSLLSDLSPLVASTGIAEEGVEGSLTGDFGRLVESVGGGQDDGGGTGEGGGAGEDGDRSVGDNKEAVFSDRLGKHSMPDSDSDPPPNPKKQCTDILEDRLSDKVEGSKPSTLNGFSINGSTLSLVNGSTLPLVNGVHNSLDLMSPSSQSSDTDSEDESSTLSPIDFTKVDPSLYDYDLSGSQDPANAPIISLSSALPLFTTPTNTLAHSPSLSSTSFTPTMTIAQPSPSLPCLSEPLSSSESSPSKSAQTDPHHPSITTTLSTDTACKNSKISGSMEGIVSTQNGHIDDTNHLASNGKLSCSQEGTSENDFFEDLVSLLIT